MFSIVVNVDWSKNWTLSEFNDDIYRRHRPKLIYYGVLLALGFLGNSLVIFVYIKLVRKKKTASNILVLYLALADLASSIVLGPLSIYTSVSPLKNNKDNMDLWCQLHRFFSDFFFLSSLFTIVSIAFERYNRICHALSRKLSHSTATLVVVGITTAAAAFSLPHGINARNTEFKIGNTLIAHICWQDVRKYPHRHYLVNFTFFAVTALFVLVLYGLLWIRLITYYNKTESFHHQNNDYHPLKLYLSSRKSFIEMSVTISSILVLFALSYIPNSAIPMVFEPGHGKPILTKDSTLKIMDVSWLISHAFNPYIYGFCDGKVRLRCNKLACKNHDNQIEINSISVL